MKKFLALMLALCLLFSLAGCGKPETVRDFDKNDTPTTESTIQTQPTEPETQPSAPVESAISPILYKVTDNSGNVVWLFGSIHVGYEHFFPLPDHVIQAYESADALAVECDILAFEKDMSAQIEALRGLMYLDGTKIADHIPQALYDDAVAALTDAGVYMSALDMYKPILWGNFLDNALYDAAGTSSEFGIDMYFLNDAYQQAKPILEVESVQFQYDLLAGFSEQLQMELLESSLYSWGHQEEALQQIRELVDAWSTGDAVKLAELLTEEPEFESEEERLLYGEYNDAMLVQRNISMADWAEEALASGDSVFICVGAAHVVGPGAMAELLTQRGYTVEAVGP